MARHPRPSPLPDGKTPNLTRGSNEPLPETTAIRILPTQNPRGSQVPSEMTLNIVLTPAADSPEVILLL